MVTTYPDGKVLSYTELSEKTRRKVETLSKELEGKRNRGELEGEGWYPVQRISMLLFNFFFFTDCVCLVSLFVCIMGMLCIVDPNAEEETKRLLNTNGSSSPNKTKSKKKKEKVADAVENQIEMAGGKMLGGEKASFHEKLSTMH